MSRKEIRLKIPIREHITPDNQPCGCENGFKNNTGQLECRTCHKVGVIPQDPAQSAQFTTHK